MSGLDSALDAIAQTPQLLVALDFDGVLAPLVDQPGDAVMLPESHRAIERLVDLNQTSVALVSGRPLESLIRLAKVPENVLMIGSHGVEMRLESGVVAVSLDDDELATLDRFYRSLRKIATGSPGIYIETKPTGHAVHTRRVSPKETERVHAAVLEAAKDISADFTVRHGKDILEFSVRGATKGDGVQLLKKRVAASAALYAGDDVTDEDAFAVLGDGDLGIKVGPGDTLARYRVADAHEFAATLTRLANARAIGR
ncbi:MAG: trehalose-phosphatase [Microbacteriaceae bacterium]